MEIITRKSMLYKTGVEYGDFTMNHALGCSHGCTFPCYAFMLKKRFGVVKSFADWCQPKLVSNTLELLEREIPRFKDQIRYVHLSFATDPFMFGFSEIAAMSIAAIKMLNAAGIKCTVLTKGILPAELADLSHDNEYGITLVSLNENFRQRYEPGTADYQSRVNALKRLHDAGCKTWVSIEPYPTPNLVQQNLRDVLDAVSFVDKIIFGRLNYSSKASGHKAFYNERADEVEDYCRARGIACYIKIGTRS